jgi:hypothetical protein
MNYSISKEITILTVNYNTSDFVNLMLFAFERLTKNTYKVLICDNFYNKKEALRIRAVANKYKNVEVIYRKQTQSGSVGHAEAMDILVSKVDTPYFVTMDADCTFLLKDWDEILISKIDGKIKVVGTALPESRINYKPMDFPLVFAVLYETETFNKLKPSFMPGDLKMDKTRDTGWQIRELYLKNGFKGLVFKGVNTRLVKHTPFANALCAVYYCDNQLIASHFSRGSGAGLAKYNNRWYFNIPLISIVFKKVYGLKEKKYWINKSIYIINQVN